MRKFNLKSQILKKRELIDKKNEIIIINSFGFCINSLIIAKSVFIGKSIKKIKK